MACSRNCIPEGIDILLNIAIVISTVVVLCLSWNDHPTYTVQVWVLGIALLSVLQLIAAVNNSDHKRAFGCKVCSFVLSFLLMMLGYQLLDDRMRLVILLIVVRICYFSFYGCLVPMLYHCCLDEGLKNAEKLPLLRDDVSSVIPIMNPDYFTCFERGGPSNA